MREYTLQHTATHCDTLQHTAKEHWSSFTRREGKCQQYRFGEGRAKRNAYPFQTLSGGSLMQDKLIHLVLANMVCCV